MTKKSTTSNKPTAKKAKTTTGKSKNGGTAEDRVLGAIAHFVALGTDTPERKEVMKVADMTNEASFKTTCGTLKRKGFADYPDGSTIKLTEAGINKVGRAALEPKSNEEVQTMLMETLKNKKTREMFAILTDGQNHFIHDLAQAIGYEMTASSFKTYLGGLSKVSEKSETPDGTKLICLKDVAFPNGRPGGE